MDFGDLFKRSWRITWNNKYLYVLGFLAALGGSGSSGGGGGSGGNFSTPGTGGSGPSEEAIEEFFREFGLNFSTIEDALPTIIGSIIAIICVLLIIRLVLWVIRMVAEAGMIESVVVLDQGGTSSFREAFAAGRPHLMPILVVNLILLALPIILVLFLLGVGAFVYFSVESGSDIESMIAIIVIPIICMVCILIPYNIIVALIYPIAQRGIIFKGKTGMDAIRFGWDFLRSHTSDILILAVLFFALAFVVGIVSLFAALPVFAATAIPAFLAIFEGNVPGVGAFVSVGIGFLLMIIILSAVQAMYIAFRSATFTLAFMELDAPKSAPDLDVAPEMG